MDGGVEAVVGFVLAHGYLPKLYDFLEDVLDQVAPFLHLLVVGDGPGAAAVGRDHRQSAAFVRRRFQPIAVEGLIADHRFDRDAVQQPLDADAIVALARHLEEARKIAEHVDQCDDPGCQTAARFADVQISNPPIAAPPCR